MMGSHDERPHVTIGRPEVWAAADALKNEVGRAWSPPISGFDFWLVRFACTLHPPSGRSRYTEASQRLT
jgi:hypothetical protein